MMLVDNVDIRSGGGGDIPAVAAGGSEDDDGGQGTAAGPSLAIAFDVYGFRAL
jgi:hypothetical protein